MKQIREGARGTQIIFFLMVCVFCAALFAAAPGRIYDDWRIYRNAAQAIVHGEALYTPNSGYFNPPWMALILIPFSFFPYRIGAGLLSTATLIVLLLISRRYNFSIFKTILLVASPVSFYTIIHTQIDALVLAGVLLPAAWWPIAALSKPQVAFGLGFYALQKEHIKSAVLIAAAVLGVSFLVFGFWPQDVLQTVSVADAPWNVWLNFWPRAFPLGVILVMLGMKHKDERLLLASSPFLLPYAAISSFLGPWVAAHTELEDWQAGLIFLIGWVVFIIIDPGVCTACPL